MTLTRTPTPTVTPTRTMTPTATPTEVIPGKPDQAEPDDTPAQAGLLVTGAAPQEHTWHQLGDVDWARFNTIAGARYLFAASAVTGLEPVLAVYAPDGTTLLATNARPGQSLLGAAGLTSVAAGSALTWSAPMTDTYFLRVSERAGQGGAGAFYTLALATIRSGIYLPMLYRPTTGVVASTAVIARSDSCSEAIPGIGTDCFGPTNGFGLPTDATVLAADTATGDIYALGGGRLSRYDPAMNQVTGQVTVHGAVGGMIVDAGRRRVYVTTGTEPGTVLAFDADTLALRAAAAGLQQAGGLVLAGDRLFVADTLAGTVRILAADDLHLLDEVAVGPGPYAVAALPALDRVFVALTGSDGVAVLAAGDGRLLGVTRLGGLGHPQGLVADEARGRVYTVYALAPRYRQIALLDGVTGAVSQIVPATLDRPLAGVEALAVDAGRGRLLASAAGSVFVYNLDRQAWEAPLASSARGPAPIFGLLVDPVGGEIITAENSIR